MDGQRLRQLFAPGTERIQPPQLINEFSAHTVAKDNILITFAQNKTARKDVRIGDRGQTRDRFRQNRRREGRRAANPACGRTGPAADDDDTPRTAETNRRKRTNPTPKKPRPFQRKGTRGGIVDVRKAAMRGWRDASPRTTETNRRKRTFSLNQMGRAALARALPWREMDE